MDFDLSLEQQMMAETAEQISARFDPEYWRGKRRARLSTRLSLSPKLARRVSSGCPCQRSTAAWGWA